MLNSNPLDDSQQTPRAPQPGSEPHARPSSRSQSRIASDTTSTQPALDLAAQLSDLTHASGSGAKRAQAALRIGARLLPSVEALEVIALEARSPRQLRSLAHHGAAHDSSSFLSTGPDAPATLGFGNDVDIRVFERGQVTQTGSTVFLPLSSASGRVLGALVLTLKNVAMPSSAERTLLVNTLRTLLERRAEESAADRAHEAAQRIQRFATGPASASDDMLRQLAGTVAELVEASRAALLLRDGTAHVLDVSTADVAEVDLPPQQVDSLFQMVTSEMPRIVSPSSGGALWRALVPLARTERVGGSAGPSSMLVLPVLVDGAVSALIVVPDAGADVSRQHEALLSAAAATAGAALALHQSDEVARERTHAYDAFISMTAHELRSPLTTVKGYAQLLLRQSRKVQVPDVILRSADAIEQQAGRMSEMIDALLDAARIRRGRLDLSMRRVNLPHVLPDWVEQWRAEYPSHELRLLIADTDLELDADLRRLHQALRALIDNAARYSSPEATIELSLTSGDGRAVLTVADEGIGVAPADRDRIFEYLYRAPVTEARNLSGLGLGLFLARSIVEHHGGTLVLEATAPERFAGSLFRIELPLAHEQ